jgi:hypothetical protein
MIRSSSAVLLAAAIVLTSVGASAASRDECVDAHGKGQELRDKGLLTRAKLQFMTCAQSSCPALVQADCARFGEELAHIVPTVTFGARDASAGDLPNTTVYVDDTLMTTRLDDGKSYELDPGKHVVRYLHDGRETTMKVVLNQGEKGRLLLATFVDPSAPKKAAPEAIDPPPPEAPKRPILPLVVAGVGGAALVTGGVLFGLGMSKVPSNCTFSTRECAGPPNDPSLDQARSGVSTANLGVTIGVAGAVTLVGGLVWYFLQPTGPDSRRAALPTIGGITF